jgi:TSC-22/dip/bun family.
LLYFGFQLLEFSKKLEAEVEGLRKQVKDLEERNSELESKCKALDTNISSLYKTACAEIERKDRMILQLRKE